MKKQKKTSLPAIGGSSLLVIFAVLCLTVFALLSLNTVLAEQRLSQAFGQSVVQWYEADLQAQEIYARLRAGEDIPSVEREGEIYFYAVPVSGHQTLEVRLRHRDGAWEVMSWQSVAKLETGDSTLPVWQG